MAADLQVGLGLDPKEFEKGLRDAQTKLNEFSDKITSVGKKLSIGLTVPLTALGYKSVQVFATFSQEMAKVAAISGATAQEFDTLKKSAEALGASTRFSATEVAGLQLNLSKLGFDTTAINNSTQAILELALATGEDLAQSAEVAAATMQGFGLEASEAGRVADVMAASFSSSALGLSKFQNAMSTVAPVAKTAGVSIEETTALLAILTNAGLDASTSGTSLRNIFLKLAKSGIDMDAAFDKINKSTNKSAVAMELFGIQGATAAVVLAENSEQARQFTKDFENSAGAAANMAAIMDDTLTGSLLNLESAAEGAMIAIGEALEPALKAITARLGSMISAFTNLDPVVRNIIVAIAATAAAIGPLLLGLGAIIKIAPLVRSAVMLMGGPFTIIASVIAAAAIAIALNWDKVKDFIITSAATVLRTVSDTILKFSQFVARIGFEQLSFKIANASHSLSGKADSLDKSAQKARVQLEMAAEVTKNAEINAGLLATTNLELGNSFGDVAKQAEKARLKMSEVDKVITVLNGKAFNPGGGSPEQIGSIDRGSTIEIGKINWGTTLTDAQIEAENIAMAINETFGDVVTAGVTDAVSQMAAAFGEGFVNGNPLEAFGQALLGSIGKILTEFGQLTLAAGIASTALGKALKNPWNPSSGPIAIAAGAALIAIGGAVKAFSSSVGSGGSGGGYSGGGSAVNPGSSTDIFRQNSSNSFDASEKKLSSQFDRLAETTGMIVNRMNSTIGDISSFDNAGSSFIAGAKDFVSGLNNTYIGGTVDVLKQSISQDIRVTGEIVGSGDQLRVVLNNANAKAGRIR